MPTTKLCASYSSDPAAVFIPPLKFEYHGHILVCNGLGQPTFDGVPDEDTTALIKLLASRSIGYKRPYKWPPKNKSQKWWRAMCAFRNLDTNGKIRRLQSRLHEYLLAEMAKQNNDEPLTTFPVMDSAIAARLETWWPQNEAQRKLLWNESSWEEKARFNFPRFVRDAVATRQSVAFEIDHRPKVVSNWPRIHDDTMQLLFEGHLGILVYTLAPKEGTQYFRGEFVGPGWVSTIHGNDPSSGEPRSRQDSNSEYTSDLRNGSTWIGTGFKTGVVFGTTYEAVRNKIEEICKRVEQKCVRPYIIKGRYEDWEAARKDGFPFSSRFHVDLDMILERTKAATVPPIPISSSFSRSPENYGQMLETSGGKDDGGIPPATRGRILEPAWTVEEEIRARAVWMNDEAKKPPYQKPEHRGQRHLWCFENH